MMAEAKIGIIGGSGLYQMDELQNPREENIETPFGEPSDAYLLGTLNGREVAFLSRHGRGHRYFPSELNYRANIWGFKKLGVEWIIGVSAVGSLKEELKPMAIVLPDQFFDRTNQERKSTFFGDGVVAHIAFADPMSKILRDIIYQAAVELGAVVHLGGVYLNMEGPAFSTRAESNVYRQWGMDIIGMTALLEARLSREAEIAYQTMAMVTDYDCWRHHEGIDDVSVETILTNLRNNIYLSLQIIQTVVPRIPEEPDPVCANALKNAIMTEPSVITPQARQRLALIIGKYI
ncbi:MAG: S-methyl-5'-thioadenosine phosphorylase [Candidatus Euphemobacter frigidus]|nr:S-methyl-5'-thioadenosine phosphorylase [Candidatus Euphemobacter frigidus]MDP8276281.1 S-methyl-5'-thioadenosine phosphorylase [Candidatus Euphemobacter frigidus]